MDDTKLQNALDELLRLASRSDSRLSAVEQRLTAVEGTMATSMATKQDIAEVVQAVTHYGKYVEGMLNGFAKTSLPRLPPQAA
jgi:hypothetical protein